MQCLRLLRLASLSTGLLSLLLVVTADAVDEYERSPINYSKSKPGNRVSSLQTKIDAGQVTMSFGNRQGYLKDVLGNLGVPVESQTLVFSRTSLQLRRISPRTPRAIYFSDDVYVGYCQSGDVLEVSVADRALGTVFYTLDQHATEKPKFERRVDNCLVCHSSSRTEGVPGHLVRSLYVDAGGTPILSSGSRIVDHTTPLEQRWGGWYVTGTHGSQKHLGNLVVKARRVQEPVDNSHGQNVSSLSDHFVVDRYLTPHSDIVALMVLEHQTLVHNRITKANFTTRQALAYDKMMKEMFDKPHAGWLESTTRRIRSVGDDLVDALLLVDEAPLTAPIIGTSGYAQVFAAMGPRDRQGRSLRELDLQTRLFKYPLSYLVYSEAFDALPDPVKSHVWIKIHHVLTGDEESPKFAHLSDADRSAILEILRETKPESIPASGSKAKEEGQPKK